MGDAPRHFTLVYTGQLELAEIPGCDNAYCKYLLTYGDDWSILDGQEDGITQITRQTGPGGKLVWNFPLEVTFKSTNAFGWPQLVLSVFCVDSLGRDIVKGYGCTHLPISAGRHVSKVHLYKPMSASLLQQFVQWVSGSPPEFTDQKFPAAGYGREVTRVKSTGAALVQLNVLIKDMGLFGYSEDHVPPPALESLP